MCSFCLIYIQKWQNKTSIFVMFFYFGQKKKVVQVHKMYELCIMSKPEKYKAIDLPSSMQLIFLSKISNALVVQLKLMTTTFKAILSSMCESVFSKEIINTVSHNIRLEFAQKLDGCHKCIWKCLRQFGYGNHIL